MSTIATARFRSALAVAAAGCLALTACAGSPESEGSTSEPATLSATASSSAPATSSAPPRPQAATSTSPAKNLPKPKMPAEAKEFSKDGYEAFVNYWFEAQNYAIATGDTKPLESVSHAECKICEQRKERALQLQAMDEWIVGGQLNVRKFVTKLSANEKKEYGASIRLEQQPAEFYGASGEKSVEFAPLERWTDTFNLFASFDAEDGWSMISVAPIAS